MEEVEKELGSETNYKNYEILKTQKYLRKQTIKYVII